MLQPPLSQGLMRSKTLSPRPRSAAGQGQRLLLLVLGALTLVAWLLTIALSRAWGHPVGSAHHGHHLDMQGPMQLAGHGLTGAGWSVSGVLAFVVAWTVMMVAMMFPGLTPMLLTVHAISRHHLGTQRGLLRTTAFVGGYLLVWTIVGALSWIGVQTIGRGLQQVLPAEQTSWRPLLLGSALVVAGLYQFTPFKQLCLAHCRSPFIEVMQRWRAGHGGALRMGLGHGLYCLGCCWALFTVLVAAGIMSLAWMLLLTLIDLAEKTLPWGRRTAPGIGVALIIAGIGILFRVISLPG